MKNIQQENKMNYPAAIYGVSKTKKQNPIFSQQSTGNSSQIESNREAPLTEAKKMMYAAAEQRMRWGRWLVISGSIVAIIGIICRCIASFSVDIGSNIGALFLQNPEKFLGPTLGVIGLGTLLWLIGSFLYMHGAMDSDPNGPDLHF